jgi:hypothetical protein
MLSVSALRALGPDGLADLLRARPEALAPTPPRSLQELSARLRHPVILAATVQRWNLPTLQVSEVLAALGRHADRPRLLALLGICPDDPRLPAVDRALAVLAAHGILRTGGADGPQAGLETDLLGCPEADLDRQPYRLALEISTLWPQPLGLNDDVASLAEERTADDLRAVLRNHGEPLRQRKPDLVAGVVKVLSNADRVRHLLSDAPPGLADHLLDIAHGRSQLQYYGSWSSLRYAKAEAPFRNPVEWALTRFLLVRRDWNVQLVMPAEVALALRGPDWSVPFNPDPPFVPWASTAPEPIAHAATAAAATALQTLTAVLTDAGTRPLPRLKSGAVGVRELRRLARSMDVTVAQVRLTLALAHALGLMGDDNAGLAPTERFDRWETLPAADRYGHLLRTWLALPSLPTADADAAWEPQVNSSHLIARRTVLAMLADCPEQAPTSVAHLTSAMCWQAPLTFGAVSDDESTHLVVAVLAEAAWLGVTGAEALSPAGRTLLAEGDVAATVSAALGPAQTRARLQTDLTAVVLGEPDHQLAATLDRMADRENRSAACVWRFSPTSVRRAMDAGADADDLLADLTEIADGDIPQPLQYLLHDVARRHGTLRGGRIGCYLRSDDQALLTEIVADRRLKKLHLQRIAPTVVVGRRPLPETLETLRGAGHAPIEEDPDGATVIVRNRPHRADAEETPTTHDAGADPFSTPSASFSRGTPADPTRTAAALLTNPDQTADRLVDIGTTIMNLSDARRYVALFPNVW